MKIHFFLFLFLYQCQISWYHTRLSKDKGNEIPISESDSVLERNGVSCFISSIPFQMESENSQSNLVSDKQIDFQFIENIRTNLKLKNINSRHIKQIYGIPNSWPYLKELESFRTNKTFERFQQIENLNGNPNDKKTLSKYAEIVDADTILYTNDQTILNNEINNCDTYYQLYYAKKEIDDINSLLFVFTLGVIPALQYENHYFVISKRKTLVPNPEITTYKFGYRKVISWLFLPTFNLFNEVVPYNQDYRFYDHSKDQFLDSLENKYSKPLPIKYLNPVYGDIRGNIYRSDSGLFETTIPVDVRFAVLRDGKEKVSFYDPINGLYKIQAIKVDQKIETDVITNGIESTLKNFIQSKLVDKIQKQFPKSNITNESFISEYRNGTYTFILEIHKPESGSESAKKELFMFSCFKLQDRIFILSKSLSNAFNEPISQQLAESEILSFYAYSKFRSKYKEPKPINLEVSMNDAKGKPLTDVEDENGEEEEDDEADDEEEEELSGSIATSEIDLDGLFALLKARTYIPKGKLDIKPGRFKFNQARIHSPKVTRSKFHIKPGRSKNFSRPVKWRR
ncbi:hypothetical protein [Leptospira paudalimensis]|uniref:Secreted protein n=1 Tax=Leptospira paudalimensis TaxID=2950024 RepID=A0ABT3MB01_9LEPT|nr:hypothetical protein [Leptospira paudalimensis]MCW7505540.1 hypothetical protein [Leptospira paudalimensis]